MKQAVKKASINPPITMISGLLILLLIEVGTTILTYKGYLSLVKGVLVLAGVVLVLNRTKWAASLLAFWLIVGSCVLVFVVFGRGMYTLLPLPIFYFAFGLYLYMSSAVKRYLSLSVDQSLSENNHV